MKLAPQQQSKNMIVQLQPFYLSLVVGEKVRPRAVTMVSPAIFVDEGVARRE
jgi:hypothetical protein